MPLGTFVAGRYSLTYNSVDAGLSRDGHRLNVNFLKRAIDQSDLYGRTLIDSLYMGVRCRLTLQALEYAAKTTGPLWPYAALGVLGGTSRLDSNLAQTIVMTATAGTPAAAAPATWTASKGIIAENNNADLLYGADLREVPLSFQIYPYDASGTIKLWVET
ncbi:MAG: hypothetical protein U0804_28805 [Gemmataceae bacterium]